MVRDVDEGAMMNDPIAMGEQLYRYARTNLVDESVAFDEQTPLDVAGMDSFCILELLLFSERVFGVSVPESHLTQENLASLASLARCLARLAGAGRSSALA
jgi:acyl carrier protein